MKNISIVILMVLLGLFSASAQKLTKEEKALEKEWEKRKNAMKPEELKALSEQKQLLEEELIAAEQKFQESDKLLNQKTSEIISLRNRASIGTSQRTPKHSHFCSRRH